MEILLHRRPEIAYIFPYFFHPVAFRILMELHRNPYFNKLPILDMTIRKYFKRVTMQHSEHPMQLCKK
jgi:hypothetical protein